jgi:putative peptide modification system cyclase
MNALAQPAEPAEPVPSAAQPAAVALLRTLVLCDLVNSTALVERLGDQRAAELFRKHDRLARALLSTHGGREIDKTDGFLLMFDRPVQAVAFALDYQRALKQLGSSEAVPLAARVGVHVGDVVAWDNAADDIANGAKPIEIEGLVKPITSRLMQLALPKQILLSGVAYALAHRAQGELGSQLEKIRWRTHGRYRFKGIPDPIPVFEVGEEGFAPLKAPPWSGKAHREVPFWRRPATLGIELSMLFALLAIPAWYLLKSEPAIAFAQRDWVVVGDLKNLTGEAAFDDSIGTAFRIGLEQSRYVNVLSDLKTRETIKLMQRDPDATDIDRAIGSEIAIRDGARALILPTIAEIGGRVRITAEVVDPVTQTTVWSESADGAGAASVLPSLDQVNQKLRVRLGEALATVSKDSMPLDKVTTGNIDALRAFSRGSHKEDGAAYSDALALYGQAIALDPDFALAHVATARIHYGEGRYGKAVVELRAARTQRDRLSARDALYVDAWYATLSTPAIADEKWRLFANMYPDYSPGLGMHAYVSWQQYNRYAEAAATVEKAIVNKNSSRTLNQHLLGVLYLGSERHDDALKQFEAAEAGGFERVAFHAMAFATQRRFTDATSALARDAGGNDETRLINRAIFALDQGDLGATRKIIADARATVERIHSDVGGIDGMALSVAALDGHASLGALRAYLQEQSANARQGVTDIDLFDHRFRMLLVAYLAARQGDAGLAGDAVVAAGTMKGYPALDDMRAVVEAEMARSVGDPERAISLLTARLNGDELYLVHVALLDAQVAGGNAKAALDSARWLSEHRGRAYTEYNSNWILRGFYVGQSSLALLRAAELSFDTGDRQSASSLLQRFRQAWRNLAQAPGVVGRVSTLDANLRSPATKESPRRSGP